MSLSELANYALIQGRAVEAPDLINQVYDLQSEHDVEFIDQPRAVCEATVAAALNLRYYGERDSALQALDRLTGDPAWLALAPNQRGYLPLASLYAEAGQPQRALDLIRRHESELTDAALRSVESQVSLRQARAAVAQAENRPLDAVAERRAVRELLPACTLCELADIGRAYDQAGEPDSAIVYYERYLDTPVLFRSGQDNLNIWFLFVRLGELYEERGDKDRAIEYYNRLLELWENSEPRLQPRVTQVRERVARLVGELR
jgi:tetratricopeptide (TPR) repeat protein